MIKRKTKLNRGQALATAVENTNRNIGEVARRAGYSRSAYYKHVRDPDLKYHILIAYGQAIGHDFTEQFPDMPKYMIEDPTESYGKPKSLEEAMIILERVSRKSRETSEKYSELLEKYNALWEKYNLVVQQQAQKG